MNSPEIFTRRDFLYKLLAFGGVAVAAEMGFLSWLVVDEKKGKPDKLGIPDNTHVEGLPFGGYSWASYDTETLTRMNGNLDDLGKSQNAQVLWAPGKIDGQFPVTKEALRYLRGHLVTRAVGEYDEKSDGGWKPNDQTEVQNLLNLSVDRVSTFFGGQPLWITGFIPVYRPGKVERERIKQIFDMNDPRGGVFGNDRKKGSLYIDMLLGDGWKGGLNELSIEEQKRFRTWLAHEYAHGFIGPLQIPPFGNHRLVDLAGQAFYLDQFVGSDVNRKDLLFDSLSTSPEAYPWRLVKELTGKDFYAELLRKLFSKHGRASLSFSKKQVMEEGEEIFQEAGAPYSLKEMLDNCPASVCSLDEECGPNSYCVNGSCISKDQFDIAGTK